MNNKEKILFVLIILIAAIVRFACINKADGLWYDELVMYNQAVQQNFKAVLYTALAEDVHLPLYQLLLHYWGKFFSFADIALRSFSAILGLGTVILGFFIGKNLKSNTVGLVTMSLFAVNSFLIYYSQEVRMYELLVFFGSLNLLALIKLPKKWWYGIWILSSTALILTYTISILYVFIEVIGYFVYKGKQFDKKFIISTIILSIVNLPIIIYLIAFKEKFTNFITGFYSDWSSLFIVLQNFFTPKLIGLENNPAHYVKEFLSGINLSDFVFVLLPLVIAIYFIIYSLKKSMDARFIFLISILFLLVEIFAFIFTDFKILSRYLIVILPNLLVIMALYSECNKKHIVAICFFITLNFSYLIFSQNSAFRVSRSGFLPLAELLKQNDIQDGDIVVVWNRKEVLSKYLDKKVLVLSILKDFAYKSEVMLEYQDELNKTNSDGKKEILRDYFKSDFVPNNTVILADYVINGMVKGQKIIFTAYDYFDGFDHKLFVKTINNDDDYKNMTYNNLITIKSLLDLRLICDKNLKYKGAKFRPPFVVYLYEK